LPEVQKGTPVSLSDLSADGSVVVGSTGFLSGQALRWTAQGGVQLLGDLQTPAIRSTAQAVSSDGKIVVGKATAEDSSPTAFSWTNLAGMQALTPLPDGQASGAQNYQATGVSNSGKLIVGQFEMGVTKQAFRWSAESGVQLLGDLEGGMISSGATDVSADGQKLVGWATSSKGQQAAYWTSSTGFVSLGGLSGGAGTGFFPSLAQGITPNGQVIVGQVDGPRGQEAFRWTAETGMVGLGDLAGGSFYSAAVGVSADGRSIVGHSVVAGAGGADRDADFIWDPVRGMRPLLDVLVNDYGLGGAATTLSGRPLNVRGISDDGLTILGDNWIADLHGSFVPGDANFDGRVDLNDFGVLKANFASGKYRNQGDFDADGQVTLSDFGVLKANFGKTSAVAVPEPSGLLLSLAASGAVGIARFARRRLRYAAS
jgi:probable HAF family extracellular repeat protein